MARKLHEWVPRVARTGARHVIVARRHRGLRPEDVMVLAYPKSGITWLRFMLVQALTQAETGYDAVRAMSPPVGEEGGAPGILPGGGRLIKSHESPRTMRSRPPRVIYLVRDGRDVAVSYYFHRQAQGTAAPTFAQHLGQFLSGTVDNYGAWHEHAMAGAELLRRRQGEVFLLSYETLLADPVAALTGISEFFGWRLDPSAVEQAVADNRPASMRGKEAASTQWQQISRPDMPFVRSAKAGGWREHFADVDVERFDRVAGPALRLLGYE